MELRIWTTIGLISLFPCIWTQSTDNPDSMPMGMKVDKKDLLNNIPTELITEENYDKMCKVMDKIVPQISEESKVNAEFILDCMMTRTTSKDCFSKNYKVDKPPTKLNDWKDVFCNTENRAKILKENFECSFTNYIIESMDPFHKPDDCERQLQGKIAAMARKGIENKFDEKFDTAMFEVFSGNDDKE